MQDKKSLAAIFSERLSLAMKKKKITQSNLAKSLGFSQNAIWKWLHETMPNTATIIKIANTCEVSLSYLIGETEDPSPDTREVGLSISSPSESYMGKTTDLNKEAKVLKLEHPLPKRLSSPCPSSDLATLQADHAQLLERLDGMATDLALIKKLLSK